eukprot:1188188-Prorocentrum_minimum.AAC.2
MDMDMDMHMHMHMDTMDTTMDTSETSITLEALRCDYKGAVGLLFCPSSGRAVQCHPWVPGVDGLCGSGHRA